MSTEVTQSEREGILDALIRCVPTIPTDVQNDTPLAQYGLNSMKQVDLMFELEDEFGITINETLLEDGTFATIESIASLVRGLK